MFDSSLTFNLSNLLALIFAGVGAYLGSYLKQKGQDQANKESIAKLTKIVEDIKTDNSDKAWHRQRQWELKRDVVLDSVRAMAVFDQFMSEFSVAFSKPDGIPTDEARAKLEKDKIEAYQKVGQITSAYQHAHSVADLAIGKHLSVALTGYFQFSASILRDIPSGKAIYDSNSRKELGKYHNAIILAARKELGNSSVDDLPVIDYNT
jgi:hypothetical protein